VTKRVSGTIVSASKPKGKAMVFTIKWDNGDKDERHKITGMYKGKNMLKTLMGID
jgi:hypothetical protein